MTALLANPALAILAIPAASAVLLALLPGYRLTARLNVAASLATLLAALSLFVVPRPAPGPYLLIDDLNIVFVVLNTFVGFTAAFFSATYISHELETGRLTPAYLRFYHGMYQLMMFGMNLALLSNNIGLMWVAIEVATLTTVLIGRHLPHPCGAGSGVEIFHPRFGRHCAGAVRHDPRFTLRRSPCWARAKPR